VIGFLRGRLAAKHPPSLVLDVGGVGYELEAPMSTFYGLPATGSELTLVTHLVVREDAHVLYGFATERERTLFRELIKVSGVGPRLALGILSGASIDEFHRCVETQDAVSLKALASGQAFEVRGAMPGDGAGPSAQAEAFSALVALGYKPAEVTRLLQKVDAAVTTTEELIRHALRAASG
jgi:Holliday junction DNA helicase RuvA